MYLNFYDLSACNGCWSLVSILRFIYNFFNVCPYDFTAIAGSGQVITLNVRLIPPIEWILSVAILIDRPKSVRNYYVFE